MALSEKECTVLLDVKENGRSSYRKISSRLGVSLGSTAGCLNKLTSAGFIDQNGITPAGLRALEPYRVKNAVILAAGMSTRFVPISYDLPKGLLEVKGEILIERQIRQLIEAGITDITLVLGFKKERFFYLADKYGVKIVINPVYNTRNNIESLFLAESALIGTYVCASDVYFTENVFCEYQHSSFFTAVPSPGGLDEYYALSSNGKTITKLVHGSRSPGDVVIGMAYFDSGFCDKFRPILKEASEDTAYDHSFFEILVGDNLKSLPKLKVKPYSNIIYEFDSLDELRRFDEKYINDVDSKILRNIASYFRCSIGEIGSLDVIKEGLTNTSFLFEVRGEKYVYRHPGIGTNEIINRAHEKAALELAKANEIDPTYVFEDEKEGWKISKYVPGIRAPSYENDRDVELVIAKMREFHALNLHVSWAFDPYLDAMKLKELIDSQYKIEMPDFCDLCEKMADLHKKARANPRFAPRLAHCDTYSPNWMITKDDKVILIDWEYAGEADPAVDIGYFVVDGEYPPERAEWAFRRYLGEECTKDDILHCFMIAALVSFYWFVWALFKESRGAIMGDALYRWYKMAKVYSGIFAQPYSSEGFLRCP